MPNTVARAYRELEDAGNRSPRRGWKTLTMKDDRRLGQPQRFGHGVHDRRQNVLSEIMM